MTKRKVAAILHCCTTNTNSGNPRRIWIGLDRDGHIIRCADEGYDGKPEWANPGQHQSNVPWDFHINVTPSWYTLALKSWGNLG